MKQVVCECGRIAEVRRRSNGQKLRYKVCKCGTSLGGVESALLLEKTEKDDIGNYGEFFEKASDDVPGQTPEKTGSSEPVISETEWVPDSETMPDDTPEKLPEKKGGLSVMEMAGYGLLLVGTVAGVVFGFKACKGGAV